jgi:predicted PurR-regulated permease PerM
MILGLLCIACMLLFRLPYAITIGTVVGVTNIIPVVGPFVGGIIGALLIFSTSTVDALIFVALVLVLQQIDANVVFPRVVGSSTGLPGIWVLAAVAVGGELGGIPFILLSVPIAASLYQLIGDDMRSREAKEATVAGDETPVTSIAEEPAAIAGDVDGASGDDGAAG